MNALLLRSASPGIAIRRLAGWRHGLFERRALLEAAKTVLAALLALVVSCALDLGSPRTAMFCVLLVMQARSGLVFQKSYYRLLGTVVGAAVSVVLIGAFAQSPALFLACFAAWVAFCTAGSFVFRNFQSYGFVLAGYTVCFVALPAIDAPARVFDVAVTRVIEMFVGVICAAVVSDTIFPQRMADEVRAALERRLRDFTRAIREAPARLQRGDTGKTAMLRFAGDALGLDAAHANVALESSDLRRRRLQLQLLNHEFMGATSSLHALHQLLRRLGGRDDAGVHAALTAIYTTFTACCDDAGGEPRPADLVARLDAWRESHAAAVAAQRERLPAMLSRGALLDFETGVEMIERFAGEFRAYCATHAGLDAPGSVPPAEDLRPARLRFSTSTDPLLAILAGLRGVAVLAVTAGFWLLSGWPSGITAIMGGVASGTVFAALPAPARMMRQALAGWAIAVPLGLVWNFALMPLAHGWPGLCVILAPPVALMAWLAQRPATAGIGAGLFISFMLHASLDRAFRADAIDFLEGSLADCFGFATAAVFYALIDPNAGWWGRQRIVAGLRRRMIAICRGEGRLQREVLESASRDLVQRIATRGQLADDTDRWVFEWLLTVLELGRAVIDLRAALATQPAGAVPAAVPQAVAALGALFEMPTGERRGQALAATEAAIGTLVAASGAAGTLLPGELRRALTLDLHFIRGALLDSSSVFETEGR